MPTMIWNNFLIREHGMTKTLLYASMILFILTLNACATNNKNNTKEKRAMTKTSLLKSKVAFRLNISCENAAMRLYLNGIQIFEDKSELPIEMEYPINDTILNGENKLTILINDKPTKKAKCSIDLVAREFNNFEMTPKKILTLSYDESKKHPIEETTPMGSYSAYDDFKPSDKGDVHIGTPSLHKHKKSATYGSNASIIHLKFDLATPFPRWKYASGDIILNKPYLDLSMEEAKDLQKNDSKLSKLYEINHAIYKLAKAKDIDGLMEYFKERNVEMDKALFDKPGTTEKELREDLRKQLNNPDMELWEISEERWENHQIVFRVDENNKLAWLTDLILLNYTKGEGSSRYTMKFRWDGEKWILTR